MPGLTAQSTGGRRREVGIFSPRTQKFTRVESLSHMQPVHAFRNIGIISRPRRSNLSEVVPPLLSWLEDRGIHVAYDQETASSLEEPSEGEGRSRGQGGA